VVSERTLCQGRDEESFQVDLPCHEEWRTSLNWGKGLVVREEFGWGIVEYIRQIPMRGGNTVPLRN